MRLESVEGPPNAGFLAGFRLLDEIIYRDDPVWAPGSGLAADDVFRRAEHGEIETHTVIARSESGLVARACAMLPTDVPAPGGQIALFECRSGSLDAGRTVLEDCRRWLVSRGASSLTAPRIDQLRYGLQTGGFHLPQTIFTAHNPSFYADIFRSVFSEEIPMVSVVFNRERVPRFPTTTATGLTIRAVNPANLNAEVTRIEGFQRAIFSGSAGYTDRSARNAANLAEHLLPMADPDLVLFAADKDGHTVGLLIALPDVWQAERPVDRARLVSIAVAPGWRGRRVAVAMGAELTRVLLAKGYQSLEGSLILKSNHRPQQVARMLGATRGRTFSLFRDRL